MNTGIVTERKREMLEHFRNSVEVIEHAIDCRYRIDAALEGPLCRLCWRGLSRLEREKQRGSIEAYICSEGSVFEHCDSENFSELDKLVKPQSVSDPAPSIWPATSLGVSQHSIPNQSLSGGACPSPVESPANSPCQWPPPALSSFVLRCHRTPLRGKPSQCQFPWTCTRASCPLHRRISSLSYTQLDMDPRPSHIYASPPCLPSETDSMSTATLPSKPKGKYHGRGRSEGHIPRPPNAFILFRSDFLSKGIFPPCTMGSARAVISDGLYIGLPVLRRYFPRTSSRFTEAQLRLE